MKVTHHAKAKRYKKKKWKQSHPKTGSWHTQKYIHGPRLRQPEQFKSIYLVDQDFAEERHVDIPKSVFPRIKEYAKKNDLDLYKNWKDEARVKIGQTKKGDLKVQSLLTPIKKGQGAWPWSKEKPTRSELENEWIKNQNELQEFKGRENPTKSTYKAIEKRKDRSEDILDKLSKNKNE